MNNYCILRQKKIKTKLILGAAYSHNYRTSELTAPGADKSLRNLNEELCEGPIKNNETFNDILDNRINESVFYQNHPVRKNVVPAVELLLTFSENAQTNFDIEKWKQENIKWLKKKYGDNLISAMYHDDEYSPDGTRTTPHIHAIVLPFDEIGQLNASKMCGNKMDYYMLQDEYAHEMEKFGLERGQLGSGDKHITPKQNRARFNKLYNEYINGLPKIKDNESAHEYRDRVEEYIAELTSKHQKELNEDKQTNKKLKAEIKELKERLDDKKTLSEVLTEKGYNKKKKKLEDTFRDIVEEDSKSYRAYERLFQYLGLDHDDITVEDIKRARDLAARGSLYEAAIQNYHDQEVSKTIAETLTAMLLEQREREKAKKKAIETEMGVIKDNNTILDKDSLSSRNSNNE